MSRLPQDLELALVLKALDEIAQEQLTDTIYFHVMGEPTLYADLERVVMETKHRKLKSVLTTNGSNLSLERLDKLLDAGIDHIVFSAQTPTQDSFKLRRAPIDFHSYKSNICSLIARVIECNTTRATLSFLTTPIPFITLPSRRYRIVCDKKTLIVSFMEWLDQIVACLQDNKLKHTMQKQRALISKRLTYFHMMGWNRQNVTSQLIFETRILGDWVHSGLISGKIKRARVGYCEGLKTHFGILSNGDMVFCCVDFDGRTSFSNIRNSTIKESLRCVTVRKTATNFRKLIVSHPYCQRCMGDSSFKNSLVRQLGSIAYFKLYRKWWARKREKETTLIS
jgi:hypothetical protein